MARSPDPLRPLDGPGTGDPGWKPEETGVDPDGDAGDAGAAGEAASKGRPTDDRDRTEGQAGVHSGHQPAPDPG